MFTKNVQKQQQPLNKLKDTLLYNIEQHISCVQYLNKLTYSCEQLHTYMRKYVQFLKYN